nr:tropomyosin alpha-1 chain-like [Aegilops tauschii subsp. strangulata]
MAPGSDEQPPPKERGGASAPSATSINPEAPNALEEALQGASIVEEHRTLMGAVMEKVQSAKNRLNEAFRSLLTGFEASMLAATAHAVEVSELNRKLQVADEELDRINKWFDEMQASAAEVETLKGALVQAKKEAEANKAAADKAAAELEAEQIARCQHEARVAEVEQEPKDAISKCETLEQETSAQSSELAKALRDAKEAWSESLSAREEIH